MLELIFDTWSQAHQPHTEHSAIDKNEHCAEYTHFVGKRVKKCSTARYTLPARQVSINQIA